MTVPRIFTHKKFQAGIAMSLLIFLGQFFPAFAESRDIIDALAAINWIAVGGPLTVAIGAQGLADWGKSAEELRQREGSASKE